MGKLIRCSQGFLVAGPRLCAPPFPVIPCTETVSEPAGVAMMSECLVLLMSSLFALWSCDVLVESSWCRLHCFVACVAEDVRPHLSGQRATRQVWAEMIPSDFNVAQRRRHIRHQTLKIFSSV